MQLKDTVEMMQSADYKERFKAEYHQTKIRYEKLKAFNTKIEAAFETNYRKNGVEMPVFDCPQDMLRNQQRIMGEYLHILEVRAVIEGIDLDCTKEKHIFGDCTTCVHAKKVGEHEWECDAEHYDIERFTCYSPVLTKAN